MKDRHQFYEVVSDLKSLKFRFIIMLFWPGLALSHLMHNELAVRCRVLVSFHREHNPVFRGIESRINNALLSWQTGYPPRSSLD